MKLLKGAFYTTCGCLMTLFYREGMEVAMNWTFIIWLVAVSYTHLTLPTTERV